MNEGDPPLWALTELDEGTTRGAEKESSTLLMVASKKRAPPLHGATRSRPRSERKECGEKGGSTEKACGKKPHTHTHTHITTGTSLPFTRASSIAAAAAAAAARPPPSSRQFASSCFSGAQKFWGGGL